jgi:hypothetical protein
MGLRIHRLPGMRVIKSSIQYKKTKGIIQYKAAFIKKTKTPSSDWKDRGKKS